MATGSGWEPFFIAASGVLAALAGLVFVALSINLDHILETPGLHLSGLHAVMLLIVPLALCLTVLMPTLEPGALFAELVVAIAALVVMSIASTRPMMAVRRQYRRAFTVKAVTDALTVVAFAVVAITVWSGDTALSWLAISVVLFILIASWRAWALLVLIELDNPRRRREGQ